MDFIHKHGIYVTNSGVTATLAVSSKRNSRVHAGATENFKKPAKKPHIESRFLVVDYGYKRR